MPKAKRKTLTGRGAVDKTAVVEMKDRATNRVTARSVPTTDTPTLQGFVAKHAAPDAKVFTDEASAYEGMPFDHETVNHSAGEFAGRHNDREADTINQMSAMIRGMKGKRLAYAELIGSKNDTPI